MLPNLVANKSATGLIGPPDLAQSAVISARLARTRPSSPPPANFVR
jgi:hypothetical protein